MQMRVAMVAVAATSLMLSMLMMTSVRRQEERDKGQQPGSSSVSLLASSEGGRWRHIRMSTGQVGSIPPSACDMERMRRCKEEMEVREELQTLVLWHLILFAAR